MTGQKRQAEQKWRAEQKRRADPRRRAKPTELQRAEADTVMFASARAVMPTATTENQFAGLNGYAPGRTTAPGSGSDHQKGVHQKGVHRKAVHQEAARPRPARERDDHEPGPPPTPRRVWVSRGVLVLIMVLQAVLTLRMSNTAFEDEGLYLYVGHLEIRHFLHGVALQGDYPSYFSGAPVLYPVLGALADSIGGLAAARALSLLEMLAVTGLIYAMSRRLFNERVALCAAIGFAVTEPALYVGRLATYDATALFLLTLATWLVVRFATAPARCSCSPRRCSRSRSPPSTRRCCSCPASSAWPGWPAEAGPQDGDQRGRARRGHGRAASRGGLSGRPRRRDGLQVHHPGPFRGRPPPGRCYGTRPSG